MTGHDLILMILLFCSGLFIGGYMYFVGFVPAYVDTTETGFNDSSSFALVGEQYGGCARVACSSFRITADRSYRYLSGGAESVELTGRLPRTDFKTITDVTTAERLSAAANPVTTNSCVSFVDGIDHRFTITLEGVEYELDTCGTALDRDQELRAALVELFTLLNDSESLGYTAEDFQEAGVIGYFFPELFE